LPWTVSQPSVRWRTFAPEFWSVLCKTTNPVFTSCRGRVGFAIGVARNGLVQDRLRQKLREARRYRAASFLHAKNNKSDMSASATLASRGTRRVEETCEVPGDGALTPPGGSGRRSHPVGLGDEVSKVWFLAVAGKELVEAGAAFAHDKGAPTHDSCLRHNRRLDSLAVVLLREAKALEGGWGVRRAHRGALLAGLASLSQIEHLPVPPCRGVRS
jgi:hypothetical protein